VRLVRRWLVGRWAPLDWKNGLVRLPRVYLRDVHEVVARQPKAARMHTCIAGGLIGALALSLVRHVFGLGGVVFTWLLMLALGILLIGIGLLLCRRLPRHEAHLSSGRFQKLPIALAFFAMFLTIETLALTGLDFPHWVRWFAAAIGAVSIVWLSDFAVHGPMRHAIAGALHLAVHPRPTRFGNPKAVAALAPLDLGAARLGAET
jgi:hypothetical protein